MRNTVNYILNKIGIDKTILFTLVTRLLQGGGGLLVIFFITTYLSKEEQGYYYTFGSIIAIQVFFELGLNTIITQFVAHEFANLCVENNSIIGAEFNKSRISSIYIFCIKLFALLAIFLFIILFCFGLLFFTKYNYEGINWKGPWLILTISTTILFFTSPILAFLEGLGFVQEIAKIRFYQQIFYLTTIISSFICRLGLFSISLASLTSAFIIIGYLIISKREILINISRYEISNKINYYLEIFPYQWKVAISWISGYFIFQLFNPVLFATEGPVIAGQMGLTLTALSGISSLSMSWITTKIQYFSTLISRSEFRKLDIIFSISIKQAVIVNAILLLIFTLFILTLNLYFNLISIRFLPVFPILLLSVITLANQFVFSWATYIRCHKSEPFLFNSIVCAILNILSIYYLGHKFGLNGIISGYFFITITIGLPWTYFIYKKKKLEWH